MQTFANLEFIHSYQFYCVQSTSSPILKSLVSWRHLVGGYLSLCYGRHVTAASLDKDNGMWIRLVIALMFFFERREKHTLNVEIWYTIMKENYSKTQYHTKKSFPEKTNILQKGTKLLVV